MTSDFLGANINSTKPVSYISTSSLQQRPPSVHIPYPIYEKPIGKELVPPHILNSKPNHTYSSNTRIHMPKYSTKDPNSVSGVGNFDYLLSNVTLKHESPSTSILFEDTTDKDTVDRTFCVPSQQLSDHYYMPRPSEPRSRNSITTTSSRNYFQTIAAKNENVANFTSGLDSYAYGPNAPSISGNTGIYDESGSTKDNSIIENNLVHNRTFLKNLESLTTLMNGPNRAQNLAIQTKYKSTGNSSNVTMSTAHRTNEPQNIQSKARKGINSSNIQANVSKVNSSSIVDKSYNYQHQQQQKVTNHYGITAQTSNPSQLPKGRSTSAMHTRREIEAVKQRNSHQQSQRDISYNAGTFRQDNDDQSMFLSNVPGPRAESHIIQQKDDISSQKKNENLRGNSQQHSQGSKNLPIHKVLKDTLGSAQLNQNHHSNSQNTAQHNSLNMGYNLNNSGLNYGQIKLDAEPVDDFADSLMKRKEYSLYNQKPYWQLKKTSAKLEASKKDLINSLMKNSYLHQNFKDIYGIEANPKLSNPVGRGTYNYRKSHESTETVPKSTNRRDTHTNSNDGVSARNADKKASRPALNNNLLGVPSSATETRNGGRKDVKSLDIKRSLSGKLNVKTGDEPGKENTIQKSSKVASSNAQTIKKIDSTSKTPSAKQKVLQAREKSQYTVEESNKKEEKDANLKFIPQLLRGRTLSKYRESPDDDDFSPATSFDLKNQASSKSFTYSKPEQVRPLSESRSNSKDILTSLKDFSYGVVKSTKDFFLKNTNQQKTRRKCKCVSSARLDIETCPKAQKWLFSKYKESELDYLKKTYEKIRDSTDMDPRCSKQIKLDIRRTYPECEFFASAEGLLSLETILQCYAKYDPKIGYVQGMNFIAASILYHAEEYIAFWILVLIFEKSEMRDVYMPNLPGLAKHSQIVDFLILNNLPELYSHFCTHNITVEMFCTEWIFGLFGSVIPVDKMDCFLDGFVDQGWLFFYKFVLALLKTFEKELREAPDMSEILVIFKSGINKREKNVFTGGKENVDWGKLVKYAYQIQLDNSFIHKMLMVFDQETKRFLLNSK